MKNSVKLGRPKTSLPENFVSVYDRMKAGEHTGVESMKEAGLTKATFYRLVKQYEAE